MIPTTSKLSANTLQQNMKLDLSRAIECADPGFTVPVPEGLKLLNFQTAGIHYCTFNKKSTLIADPPGVGKTIQALGYANLLGLPPFLVLAPATMIPVWKNEINKWSVKPLNIEIYHPKTFDPRKKRDVLLVSYYFASLIGAVKQILDWGGYALMIIDEAHNLKNSDAKRTKYVLSKNALVSKAEKILAMTGTPIVNRPMELYPLIATLAPEALGGMSRFEYGIHFCAGFQSPWGWDFTGASNLKLLGMKLRSTFMLRRPKEDILKELPERLPPNLIYLDQSKKAQGIVAKMKTFDASVSLGRVGTPEFTELSRARRELGIEKIGASVEYIKAQLDGGHEKIIVFAHHKDVIKGLTEALSDLGVVSVTGETDSESRQRAIASFQTNRNVKIFIGSIGAASVGITLTAASYVIFVEFSYVPGENEQAIDRAHRIGQKYHVMTDYLVYEDSLDERILKLLLEKYRAIEEVTA